MMSLKNLWIIVIPIPKFESMENHKINLLPPFEFFKSGSPFNFYSTWKWEFYSTWLWERLGKPRNEYILLNISIEFNFPPYWNEPNYIENHITLANKINHSILFNSIPKPKIEDILTCLILEESTNQEFIYCFRYDGTRWSPSCLPNYDKFYHVTRKIASGVISMDN